VMVSSKFFTHIAFTSRTHWWMSYTSSGLEAAAVASRRQEMAVGRVAQRSAVPRLARIAAAARDEEEEEDAQALLLAEAASSDPLYDRAVRGRPTRPRRVNRIEVSAIRTPRNQTV
jgi:hypothetical protein